MKKLYLLLTALVLSVAPISLQAGCNLNFSFLLDAASLMMGPRYCPPPPPAPVHIVPIMPHPMPYYPGKVTVTREYWTPYGVYYHQSVRPY